MSRIHGRIRGGRLGRPAGVETPRLVGWRAR
jgi:hypothetical protein